MIRQQNKYRNAFLIPSIVVLAVVGLAPFFYTLGSSFVTWELTKPYLGRPFVFIANYVHVLTDANFWGALKRTLIFSIVSLSIEMVLGFLIALLANFSKPRLAQLFVIMILPPSIIAPVIAGFLWRFMYDAQVGMVNYMISLIGIPAIAWLGKANTAMGSVIMTDIWEWTPFVTLILFSGLRSLPIEIIESAEVDGANLFQKIRYVILPMIKIPIMVALLFRGMDVLRWFDTIRIMTNGGPGSATHVLSNYLYEDAFVYFHIGTSAAIAFLMLIMVIFFSQNLIKLMAKEQME
jgi:multiple sugar transport system permease protein